VHPLASLQMEYSLFSRDAEQQGQIDACKALNMTLMAYGVLGRGQLTGETPTLESMGENDIRKRQPRFQPDNAEANTRLRAALETIARRKGITMAQLAIAWPMAQGERAGVSIVPIPSAKSRRHLEENVAAAAVRFSADELAEIDRLTPPGAAAGTRYPEGQMHRVNVLHHG
jgi:aryl-alcohol dehydrogenase-like predicted oxidoreductase